VISHDPGTVTISKGIPDGKRDGNDQYNGNMEEYGKQE
jgi:hypothetical protein